MSKPTRYTFLVECSLAEEIVSRAKTALKKAGLA